MSQIQEFRSSQLSLFDTEPDDLSSIATASICPATPSTSRQVDSFSFIQPSIPSSIALDPLEPFERIGPGKRGGEYFLYNAMNHNEWVKWWLETDYGLHNHKIAWDSRHGSAAETWKEFDQVAHAETGSPKVICKRCDAVLEHPYAIKKDDSGTGTGKAARHGTTTITRHLQTSGCRRTASGRRQREGLTRFLQAVC